MSKTTELSIHVAQNLVFFFFIKNFKIYIVIVKKYYQTHRDWNQKHKHALVIQIHKIINLSFLYLIFLMCLFMQSKSYHVYRDQNVQTIWHAMNFVDLKDSTKEGFVKNMFTKQPANVAAILVSNLKSIPQPVIPMLSLLINSSFDVFSIIRIICFNMDYTFYCIN